MAMNGSQQLNAMYRPSPTFNVYNPGGVPYDDQTEQAISDYVSSRDAIFAASATSGEARDSILELIRLTDQCVHARDNADQAVKFYQPSTSATSSTNMQKANTAIDGAVQLATSSVEKARALIPGIKDAVYMNVKVADPGKWTNGNIDQARADYLSVLTTASDKQLQAEQVVSSVINYYPGAYVMLNGSLDMVMQSLGINLVRLHQAYANALRAAKKDVPGDKMITLMESGALEQLCQLAETVANRCIQVARQELAANFA